MSDELYSPYGNIGDPLDEEQKAEIDQGIVERTRLHAAVRKSRQEAAEARIRINKMRESLGDPIHTYG